MLKTVRRALRCRQELEGKVKGVDIFHEDWCAPLFSIDTLLDAVTCCVTENGYSVCARRRLDAPWGTADKPVEVTSSFAERIVGVPDPYDDSIV